MESINKTFFMRQNIFVLVVSLLFTAYGQNDTKQKGPDLKEKQVAETKYFCDDLILPETDLEVNHKHYSPGNLYFAMFQSDGNFVLYKAGAVETPVWSSGTNGTGANRCRFQDDGTIVIYKDATPLKVFGRQPPLGMKTWFLKVQEDGSLVIYADYRNQCLWVPLWGSGHSVWSDAEINNYITTHPCMIPPPTPLPPTPPSGLKTKVVLRNDCKYGQSAFIVNSDPNHAYISTLKTTVETTGNIYYDEKSVPAGGEYYIGCTSLDGIHFNKYEVTGERVKQ